jgi:asparagine synthase (glutamine-hydrolysing)
MANEDGTIWITFNGEIYGFRALRDSLEKKGHVFASESDTEVILHLYEEEGLACIERLNGMFAFALWDENKARLWVCRDRLGIKPLVYYCDDGQLVFASEIKALLRDSNVPKALDYRGLYLYLAFNYVPAPYTIFAEIKKLEPGHYITLEKGKVQITRYWDIPTNGKAFSENPKFYNKRLYACVEEAVAQRMHADVSLGAFLSGGIDSSLVVGLMAKHSPRRVKTFSIGFRNAEQYDETSYARTAAEFFKTEHHEFKLSHQDLLHVLPDVLSMFDEPFADSSAIPTYIVSKETKKHVTVALSGDGGDELFAGYRSYLGEYWYSRYVSVPALLRVGLLENIVESLPDSRDGRIREHIRRLKKFIHASRGSFPERCLALKEVIPSDVRKAILLESAGASGMPEADPALDWVRNKLGPFETDRINNILYSDVKCSLPGDMLTKVDWMSMRNSLEVRVPLLDYRVVELAFGIHGTSKLRGGKTKYILRETFKDLLPESIYRRKKAGFEVPISRWLKGDLKFLIEKYLAEDRIRDQSIFDYSVVAGLIQDFLCLKRDTSWILWNLIVFQHWYDSYYS